MKKRAVKRIKDKLLKALEEELIYLIAFGSRVRGEFR